MKRVLTINSDASYNFDQSIGGYAYWIRSKDLFVKGSGVFKKNPGNSQKAEIAGIGNAISVAIASKDLKPVDLIIINNDCINGFEKITLKSNCPYGRRVARLLKELRNVTSTRGILPKFESGTLRLTMELQTAGAMSMTGAIEKRKPGCVKP